jgi:hypothetical protein
MLHFVAAFGVVGSLSAAASWRGCSAFNNVSPTTVFGKKLHCIFFLFLSFLSYVLRFRPCWLLLQIVQMN